MRLLRLIPAFALGLAACGPMKFDIKGSARAPDADAHIAADIHEDAHLTKLEITIEHLAPADRLASGASTYVVWARPGDDKPWTRVGALDYDEGDREGTLRDASVGEIEFQLSITAEKGASPAAPSADVIFAQNVKD